MGLFVKLSARIDQIDSERWEAAWITSIPLLERFPGRLTSLRRDADRENRWVRSYDLIHDQGTKTERWKVEGEAFTRRLGESFELFRHLEAYQSPRQGDPHEGDLLNQPVSREWGYWPGGREIFNAKTQRYPFHYAMLAVGMLFETWFPLDALVTGDIDAPQADRVRGWAEAVLGTKVLPPIVTDAARLWQRLAGFGGETDDTVTRFFDL